MSTNRNSANSHGNDEMPQRLLPAPSPTANYAFMPPPAASAPTASSMMLPFLGAPGPPSTEMVHQQQAMMAMYAQQQQQLPLLLQPQQQQAIPGFTNPSNEIDLTDESSKKMAPEQKKPSTKKGKGEKKTTKKKGTRSPNYKLDERLRLLRAVHKLKPTSAKRFKKNVKKIFDGLRGDDEPNIDRDGKSLYEQFTKMANCPKAERVKKFPGHEEVFKLLDEHDAGEGKRNGVRSTNPDHELCLDGLLAVDDSSEDDDDDQKRQRKRIRKATEEKKEAAKQRKEMMDGITTSLKGITDILKKDSENPTGGAPGVNEQVTSLKHDMDAMKQSIDANQKKTQDTLELVLAKLNGGNGNGPGNGGN